MSAVFNMIFARYGNTVLFGIGNISFTAESLFYGFCQGLMFCSVIMWFLRYSSVVTSQSVIAVFGRFSPKLALVFSMAMSFIPRLAKNAEGISDAGFCLRGKSSAFQRGVRDFSALLTMTLEESVEVANSMKARGFNGRRRPYSKYRFSYRDGICLALLAGMFVILCVLKHLGASEFIYEPVIMFGNFSYAAFALFAVFSFFPLIVDLTEDIRWFCLKQKI